MPFFSSSSLESSHPRTSGESLSEAFLDSSSARDALPEEYRTQFDELREGILAFCHEFDIPNEALKNTKAFGIALRSPKIPQERMAEAVLLFERLEHLVMYREPLKEMLPKHLQETERLYHLTEQYTAQVALLEQAGILKEGVITGIDGKRYPVPTLEQIASRLLEREPDLQIKRDQGFTKLLLVPFGMSLDSFQDILRKFLLEYRKTYPYFDLDTSKPLFVASTRYPGADLTDTPNLIYDPQIFHEEEHGGKTKSQILEEQANQTDCTTPGWRIHLLQPSDPTDPYSLGFASIPKKGQERVYGEEHPRHDLPAGQSPEDYLFFIRNFYNEPDSSYYKESGLTPEDWMMAFMVHLRETGRPLDEDDYGRNNTSMSYLLGAVFPSLYCVPRAFWFHDGSRVYLSMADSNVKSDHNGVRTSVIV